MLQINAVNEIVIDNRPTGLGISQTREGTVIFTRETVSTGKKYQEHPMPYARYSSAHDAPHKPGQQYDPNITAGRSQLEADVRALLEKLGEL